MIRFEFTDANNKAVALHVRRGVVEYADNADRYCRKPDFTLVLTRETWTKHSSQPGDRDAACWSW